MSLPDRLRAVIADSHTAIENTAAAKAMISGTVDRDTYVALMAEMGRLHAAFEERIADQFPGLYDAAAMARADVISRDLVALGDYGSAAATGNELFDAWTSTPWKLIGVLYVLEGSRMGSMALVRPVARALGVDVRPGVGVDYHLDGMATRPMVWAQFKARLAAYPFTPAQQDDIAAAAVETMHVLQGLYAAVTATADLHA
jgi:heme oxygenase